MRAVLGRLNSLSLYAAAVFIATITVIILLQVGANAINRAFLLSTGVSPGLNLPSYSDFVSVLLASAGALSLAGTFERGGHIRVMLLLANLPPRSRRFAEILCLVIVLLIGGGLTYGAFLLAHDSWIYGDVTYGHIPIVLWIPQTAIFFGLLLLLINIVYSLYVTVLSGEPPYAPSAPSLPE